MLSIFRYITDWIVDQTNAMFQILLIPLKSTQKTVQSILTGIDQAVYAFMQELESVNQSTLCHASKTVCNDLRHSMADVQGFIDKNINSVYNTVGSISKPIENLNSTVSQMLVRGALGLSAVFLGLIGALGLLIIL